MAHKVHPEVRIIATNLCTPRGTGVVECLLIDDTKLAWIACIAGGALFYMSVMAGVKARTARDPKTASREKNKRG